MGIYSQGAGWGPVNGNLLRENIRGKGNPVYTDLTGFLLKPGLDDDG